jgi:hypothetical protein
MTTSISTQHANELILVDDVLEAGGGAVVWLGLINQDGSDTFPGRTLTPDQAEELAAALAQAAAAARGTAGLAPAPLTDDQARAVTLEAVRVAVPLAGAGAAVADAAGEEAGATSSPAAKPNPAPSRRPKASAKPRAPAKKRTSSND